MEVYGYILKAKGTYVVAMAWFSDTLPVITMGADDIQKAHIFPTRDNLDVIKQTYEDAEFLPVRRVTKVEIMEELL